MTKKAKGKTDGQTDEQKLQARKDAFARVVPTRVNSAVKALRLLKQCASGSYSYTDTQKEAVLTAVQVEYDQLREAFENKSVSAGGFELPTE